MKWHIFVIFLIDMLAVQSLEDQKMCFNKYGTAKYPGKSCADILKKCIGSTADGVYWIALRSGNTKPFPVFCDMKAGGWTMVFKAIAGVSGRIAGYWKLPYGNFEYSLEALNEGDSFKHHYKNRIVQNWNAFKPMEARVVMYKKSEEKMVLRFDAKNSSYMNWFSASRLREAPWQDILTGHKNFFVLEGPCWGGKCRDFHINSVYPGCNGDVGWLSVGDSRACSWERRFPENSFLYSNRANMVNYNEQTDVGNGDVFAVYLH